MTHALGDVPPLRPSLLQACPEEADAAPQCRPAPPEGTLCPLGAHTAPPQWAHHPQLLQLPSYRQHLLRQGLHMKRWINQMYCIQNISLSFTTCVTKCFVVQQSCGVAELWCSGNTHVAHCQTLGLNPPLYLFPSLHLSIPLISKLSKLSLNCMLLKNKCFTVTWTVPPKHKQENRGKEKLPSRNKLWEEPPTHSTSHTLALSCWSAQLA